MDRTIKHSRLRGRTVGVIAAAGVAFALLAGCAQADTAPANETTEPAEDTLSGELTVFAAASLEPAFEELMVAFSEAHPDVTFASASYDGSSVLATQILGGAPVDVYASADEPNMAKVTDGGLAEGEPVAFATSELVIAVAPGNPLGIENLADLTKAGSDGAVPVTVICAPEVPCGRASHTLLDRDGVALTPASEEQNVTAVLTKVRENEADAGLVYRSDVLRSDGEAEAVTIENASEAAGLYLVAPLKDSASPEAASAFAEFMLSDEAQSLFKKLGFAKVPAAA